MVLLVSMEMIQDGSQGAARDKADDEDHVCVSVCKFVEEGKGRCWLSVSTK